MKNVSQYELSVALPMPGSSIIKSPPAEPPVAGDGVQGYIFGDMLATVAQDPERSDLKDNDTMSSDSSDETCLASCVISAGRPETMLHTELYFSEVSHVIERPSSSDSMAAISLGNQDVKRSRPSLQIDKPQAHYDETAGILSMSTCILAPQDKKETPEFQGSPVPPPKSAVKPEVGAGRISERFAKRQSHPQFSLVDEMPLAQAPVYADIGEATPAVTKQSEAVFSALPEMTSRISLDTTLESSLILPIHVKELATHLPALITRAVAELPSLSHEVADLTLTSSPAVTPQPVHIKILTFDLHPEALGPVTVRMRLSGKQVDIAIDVKSENVRSILTQSKESMVEALAEHGLRLEGPDIRLTTTSASPIATMEARTANNESSILSSFESFGQDHGHAHHEHRSAYSRHQTQTDEQSQKVHGDHFDIDKRAGIFL